MTILEKTPQVEIKDTNYYGKILKEIFEKLDAIGRLEFLSNVLSLDNRYHQEVHLNDLSEKSIQKLIRMIYSEPNAVEIFDLMEMSLAKITENPRLAKNLDLLLPNEVNNEDDLNIDDPEIKKAMTKMIEALSKLDTNNRFKYLRYTLILGNNSMRAVNLKDTPEKIVAGLIKTAKEDNALRTLALAVSNS